MSLTAGEADRVDVHEPGDPDEQVPLQVADGCAADGERSFDQHEQLATRLVPVADAGPDRQGCDHARLRFARCISTWRIGGWSERLTCMRRGVSSARASEQTEARSPERDGDGFAVGADEDVARDAVGDIRVTHDDRFEFEVGFVCFAGLGAMGISPPASRGEGFVADDPATQRFESGDACVDALPSACGPERDLVADMDGRESAASRTSPRMTHRPEPTWAMRSPVMRTCPRRGVGAPRARCSASVLMESSLRRSCSRCSLACAASADSRWIAAADGSSARAAGENGGAFARTRCLEVVFKSRVREDGDRFAGGQDIAGLR